MTVDFSYCLNTSTVAGQRLGIVGEIELAAEAGYDGIEVWIRSLDEFVGQGGRLGELGRRATDLGILIENAIGFAPWIVDDPRVRAAGLELAAKRPDLVLSLELFSPTLWDQDPLLVGRTGLEKMQACAAAAIPASNVNWTHARHEG